jgi:hypothetical protein
MLLNGDVLNHEMDGEGHEQGKVSFSIAAYENFRML